MDYGALLSDSFAFTRAALTGDARRGIALVVLYALMLLSLSAVQFVLSLDRVLRFAAIALLVAVSLVAALALGGYASRILRRPFAPPDLEDPAGLILAGVRLVVVSVAYMLPLIIVLAVFGGLGVAGIISFVQTQDVAALLVGLRTLGLGVVLGLIVWVIVGVAWSLGLVRSARRDSVREAFNISSILEHIGRIGWVNYIVALLLLWIVIGIAVVAIGVFSGLPVLGWVIGLAIGIAILIFSSRYLSLVYESAPAP